MKNIENILKDAGVELTDEQKNAILEGVKENYKTVNDWQKQVDKANSLQESLDATQEALKKFDGVDADALNKKIEELQNTINENETSFRAKLADRDFDDLVKTAISEAKGLNDVAIRALLNLDDLKASKNQKEDIAKAIKGLTEADNSKMLFGETVVGKAPDIPGTVVKGGKQDDTTLHSALADRYNN